MVGVRSSRVQGDTVGVEGEDVGCPGSLQSSSLLYARRAVMGCQGLSGTDLKVREQSHCLWRG